MDPSDKPTNPEPGKETAGTDAPSRSGHSFAIGYYIGSLVLVFGLVLMLTGLFGPTRPADERIGFDVSLWWGLLMALGGLGGLVLTRFTQR